MKQDEQHQIAAELRIKGYLDAAREAGYDGTAVFTLSYLLPYLDACLDESYLGAYTD